MGVLTPTRLPLPVCQRDLPAVVPLQEVSLQKIRRLYVSSSCQFCRFFLAFFFKTHIKVFLFKTFNNEFLSFVKHKVVDPHLFFLHSEQVLRQETVGVVPPKTLQLDQVSTPLKQASAGSGSHLTIIKRIKQKSEAEGQMSLIFLVQRSENSVSIWPKFHF